MAYHSEQTRNTGKAPLPVFFAAFIMVFFLTLSALQSVGWVPYYIDGSAPPGERVALSSIPQLGDETIPFTTPAETNPPERIIIPSIGMDLPVQNPATKDNAALDALLTDGPVRYPDSALLGENSNMFVFAHSSHLKVVHNKMYQAFNRINELAANDLITVRGGGKDYVYRVERVRLTDANEETIDLSPTREPKLTLSTCDNFGAKSARYVVEAAFVGSYPTGLDSGAGEFDKFQ